MSQEKQQTTPEEVSSVRVLGRVSELPEHQTQGKLTLKLVNPQTGEYRGIKKPSVFERYLPPRFRVKVGGPLPLHIDEACTRPGVDIKVIQDIWFVDRGGDEACHWILASDTAAVEVVLPIFAKKNTLSKEDVAAKQAVNTESGGLWQKIRQVFSRKQPQTPK